MKTYLGDGVYVDYAKFESFHEPVLILTTEDGLNVTNRVVLEWDVYAALELFVKRIALKNKEAHDQQKS